MQLRKRFFQQHNRHSSEPVASLESRRILASSWIRQNDESRGSVLIYALVLMALLLSSALSLATLASYGTQTTRRLIDSVPAYYAAESCLEQILNQYVGVASSTRLYINGDITDPAPTSGNDPNTNKPPVVLFPEQLTPFEIAATCTVSAKQQTSIISCGPGVTNPKCPTPAPTSPTTITVTDSLTFISYGKFGKSTEGLSVTISGR